MVLIFFIFLVYRGLSTELSQTKYILVPSTILQLVLVFFIHNHITNSQNSEDHELILNWNYLERIFQLLLQ